MRYFLILCTTLFSLNALQAQKYDATYYQQFPGLDEVVPVFYAANKSYLSTNEDYINFEKHQDGWYANFATWNNGGWDINKKEKIWDAKTAQYLLKAGPIDLSEQRAINIEYKKVASLNAYLWPVYGYEGASKEVVELLTSVKLKDLNASELEGLARAYEEEANYNYLGNYGHLYNLEVRVGYDSLFHLNQLDSKLMAAAEKNAWKSLEVYKELLARFPEHQSIIGSMHSKYANVAMAHYLNLEIYQQFKSAQKFLKVVDYPEDMLEIAKNYLRSCPPNAILFTHGDNDTYPLLYVQEKLNYRTDVTVVNRNLMAVGRYIYYIRNLIAKKQQVAASLDMNNYRLANNNIIPFKDTDFQSVDFKGFMDEMNEKFAKNPDLYKTKGYAFYLLSKKIDLAKDLSIEIEGNYIVKDELCLLDIITTNWQKRPICFTNGSQSGLLKVLFPFLEQHGLVGLLTNNMQPKFGYLARLNVEKTEQLFFKEFVYPKIEAEKVLTAEYMPSMSYILALQKELILHYIKKEELSIAKKIQTDLYKIFPIGKYPYGYTHRYFAEICLEFKQKDIAQEHVLAYGKELLKDLEIARTSLTYRTALERVNVPLDAAYIQQIMDSLLTFAEKNDLEVEALKAIFEGD